MKLTFEITYKASEESALKFIEDLKKDNRVDLINIETEGCKLRTPTYYKNRVFNYFGIRPIMADSNTRKTEIVRARQIAMFFSKSMTKASLATIGREIGNKDHATVMHAVKTVNNEMLYNKEYRALIEDIESRL